MPRRKKVNTLTAVYLSLREMQEELEGLSRHDQYADPDILLSDLNNVVYVLEQYIEEATCKDTKNS